MRWTPVLLVALVALLATATTAPARPAAALEHQGTLAQDVIDELNRVRAARGLARLHSQAGLRAAANEHSQAMLTAGFFAHESPDGTLFHNRIRKHYPSRGWHRWSVGETLLSAGGTLDARSIVAAWLDSPSHRQIVLSAAWRRVGIGAVGQLNAPASVGALAVTADFGLREK
jgi:uncharacterized protein YkwD